MQLPFSKMHGIGNDFVVLDCRRSPFALDTTQIRTLANRHTGAGFDQLLSVEPARDPSCAFYYGIWNGDGTPSGQCGNGVRCIAAWLHRAGDLAIGTTARIESPSGPVTVRLVDAGTVIVDMGEPVFDPPRIPFDAAVCAPHYLVDVGDVSLDVGAVSMGNPHVIIDVATLGESGHPGDLHGPVVATLGPLLSVHPAFARGVNAGFVQRIDRSHLVLRVHERGAGWTLACGTGACAAMAVLRTRGEVDDSVEVRLPGGTLTIDWAGPGQSLWMTGPAAFVFDGSWAIPAG